MKRAAAIAGLLLLFGLLNWNSFEAPFERDEGGYAYSAWVLRQGDLPYKDAFEQKPPMVIYTYFLGQLLEPVAVWPPRFLAALFLAGTMILMGLVAWKEFEGELGGGAGFIAMYLVLPMILFPVLTPFAANTEKFMLLPLLGVLALYVFNRDSRRGSPWFWGGVLSALALFYKPIALTAVSFIFLVWSYELMRGQNGLKFLFRNLSLALTGFILAAALVFGYFLVRGAGGALWETLVDFNRSYARSFGLSFSQFLSFLAKFWRYRWILFILSAWYCVMRPPRAWFYLGLLFVSVATIFTSPIGHYYILLMPFWALITSAAVADLGRLAQKRLGVKNAAAWITAAVLALLLWPMRRQILSTPAQLNQWVYGDVNPFMDSPEVARRVGALTSPGEKIFIAGSEPQIYYYAQRRSIGRFGTTYPLNVPTARREAYQEQAVKDLEENPPPVIVVSRYSDTGLWDPGSPGLFMAHLNALLSRRYSLIGGTVWEGGGKFSWRQPLRPEEVRAAGFLVFRRSDRAI